MRTETCPEGYEHFRLKQKRLRFRVHRLVAEAFIPNPNNKLEVNHINGIKTDNKVDNLEWCSSEENIIHSKNMFVQKFIMSLDPAKSYSVTELLDRLSPP